MNSESVKFRAPAFQLFFQSRYDTGVHLAHAGLRKPQGITNVLHGQFFIVVQNYYQAFIAIKSFRDQSHHVHLLDTDGRVFAFDIFDDINFAQRTYDPWAAYGQSKTANALFAVALDARAADRGIHAYSLHPGGILTDLQRHMPREELIARRWMDEQGNPNPLFKTAQEGAATGLWAATAPELIDRGGVYCEDCSIKGVVPPDHADMTTGGVKEWAIDVDAAERLFDLSVAATGLEPFGG